jgi:uncharacterized protein YecE (DUF72 family)
MHDQDSFDTDKYIFRGIHPHISIGTASDRYRGWIGQIYTDGLYDGKMISRTNRVGKNSFREQVLPVDCVREYFEHFRVLEIDYTFYAPLIEKLQPTPCAKTLGEYAIRMGPEDRVFLKAPQMFFAQKVRRGKDYVPNESYLDPEAFTRRFYEPAVELLGPKLKGFIFEQEYQRFGDRVAPAEFARNLEVFFGNVPEDTRYHVEVRTEAYLSEPVFSVFRKHGIGQVLSHWTWLPNLKRQFGRAGGRFIDAGGQAVIRLMTPLGVRYEDAYAKAFPFDKLIEDMVQPSMIPQTAELMWEGVRQGIEVNVIINNRAGGNAPGIAQLVAKKFVQMEMGGET